MNIERCDTTPQASEPLPVKQHDHSHTVETMPPAVCIIIVRKLTTGDKWYADALESLSLQSYPNVHSITVDSRADGASIGASRNRAVSMTDAPFIGCMGEEDMMTADTIACMVDMHKQAKNELPGIVHTSTGVLMLVEHAAPALCPLVAPGIYERAHLIEYPFDDVDRSVDQLQARRLELLAKETDQVTAWKMTHHFGYLMRLHPFRRDGITLRSK